MINIERIAQKLEVDEDAAKYLVQKAEKYHNQGKGLVLVSKDTIAKTAEMFDVSPIWLNCELNEAVGWQFSQAVFYLRRAGWKIDTIKLSPTVYAYKYISKPILV